MEKARTGKKWWEWGTSQGVLLLAVAVLTFSFLLRVPTADQAVLGVLERQARAMLPRANLANGSRWMGPRPGTPDSLPAIGPLPGFPNILIAAGHGHLGLNGGPNTGRIVASMASDERLNMDLRPYAPGRFDPAPREEVAVALLPDKTS